MRRLCRAPSGCCLWGWLGLLMVPYAMFEGIDGSRLAEHAPPLWRRRGSAAAVRVGDASDEMGCALVLRRRSERRSTTAGCRKRFGSSTGWTGVELQLVVLTEATAPNARRRRVDRRPRRGNTPDPDRRARHCSAFACASDRRGSFCPVARVLAQRDALTRRRAAAPAVRGRPAKAAEFRREARAFVGAPLPPPAPRCQRCLRPSSVPVSEKRATRTRASGRVAGCAAGPPSARLESRAPPSRLGLHMGLREHRRATRARKRSTAPRVFVSRARSDRAWSFDTASRRMRFATNR